MIKFTSVNKLAMENIDFETAINTLDVGRFEMNKDHIIRVLSILLYPNESFYSLTNIQLDMLRELINKFR